MSEKGGFVRSLLFDHLLAKLLALALAVVTVYLIEQELSDEVDWVDPSRRLPVLLPGETWTGDPLAARIVLRPDPGVLVTNCEPRALKVRLQGPANRKDDFDGEPVVYVDVKSEWTSESWAVVTRTITETDFELYGKGVKITLAEALKIEVDLEAGKTVAVTLRNPGPQKLPEGYVYDRAGTVLEPAEVLVKGPRSVLEALGADNPLELELRDRASFEDGKRYLAGVPKSSKWLRLETGTTVMARLALTLEQLVELDLGEFDVFWTITNQNLGALQSGALKLENIGVIAAQRARIVVEGRPAVVARHEDTASLARLRESVFVLANPSSEIAESIAEETDKTIPVRVFGLPDGLSVRKIEPEAVSLKIRK